MDLKRVGLTLFLCGGFFSVNACVSDDSLDEPVSLEVTDDDLLDATLSGDSEEMVEEDIAELDAENDNGELEDGEIFPDPSEAADLNQEDSAELASETIEDTAVLEDDNAVDLIGEETTDVMDTFTISEKTVRFAYNSSRLNGQSKKALQSIAEKLKSNPEVRAKIEGHTDAIGSRDYNIRLGVRRANAVRTYLISLGVSDSSLSIASFGEAKPASAANKLNRRAVFILE